MVAVPTAAISRRHAGASLGVSFENARESFLFLLALAGFGTGPYSRASGKD
jgi:hypothetical protein